MSNTRGGLEWERIEREVQVAMPMPVGLLVRETAAGSWEAKTSDLGTPVHVVASTRAKALERLERLVASALARLVSERARAAS